MSEHHYHEPLHDLVDWANANAPLTVEEHAVIDMADRQMVAYTGSRYGDIRTDIMFTAIEGLNKGRAGRESVDSNVVQMPTVYVVNKQAL